MTEFKEAASPNTRRANGGHNGRSDKAKEEKSSRAKDHSKAVTIFRSGNFHFIWSFLTGASNPVSQTWTLFNLSVNIGLSLMMIDAIFTAPWLYPARELSFTRTGYVSHQSADILIREPDTSRLPITLFYRLEHRTSSPSYDGIIREVEWQSAEERVTHLSDETDYTAVFRVQNLLPDSSYEYMLTNNHSGYFYTAPLPGNISEKREKAYTFFHSSCLIPRFPYSLSHPLRIRGLTYVAEWISRLQPYFMLFLGDFIYIDVPFRQGSDKEAYRREYRQVYASPDWHNASARLPWIHVLDDHEIANDWHSNTTGLYPAATDPWQSYHVSVNPPRVRPDETYFTFTQGPATFFLMDTRRYRSPDPYLDFSDPSKTMLGKLQFEDLISFLQTPAPQGVHWKFVISSVPFTKNWRFGEEDVWGGFLAERRKILEAMWDASLDGNVGVVILSGDRHEFAATAFPPPKGEKWPLSATVHEFSTSPLSMFYLPTRTYKQMDEEDICLK